MQTLLEQYDFEVQHRKGESTEMLMPFHVDLTFVSSVKRSSLSLSLAAGFFGRSMSEPTDRGPVICMCYLCM